MKLCRVGPVGQEVPCLVDKDGVLRDLTGHVSNVDADVLSPTGLARLAGLDTQDLPQIEGQVRYGVPVAGTRKFIAIGLNYADHAAEANLPIPSEPIVFSKWISCLQGADDPIVIPRGSTKTDWEVELGVVIGTPAYDVSEARALDHVAGYCVVNDVSERHWQLERGATWDKGKGFPSFGPVGPWLVTADEVGDPQSLAMRLEVNGARVQDGNTATMIFNVAQIVSYCSRFVQLEAGDIITTGTPPGVGMGQKPEPWFLKAGDVIDVEIEKLGRQRQTCISAPA
jgi:2-keto-4-pentenoate hydratase/2-oxohepta-3-ene-1,7-dioic acid hydratase in catechol pathway